VDVTNAPVRAIMNRGVATIPEDRIGEGLVMEFSVEENLVLGRHGSAPFKKGAFLDGSEVSRFAARCIESFGVTCSGPSQATSALSGGNLQRVILARELAYPPKVLIANQPTRGLDVGGMEYVHKCLLEQAARGAAILLISEDLDELLDLSDRIGVMFRGEMVAILNADEAEVDQIGLLMAGGRECLR
jgi:simple sugar transport system ATP-binding protein